MEKLVCVCENGVSYTGERELTHEKDWRGGFFFGGSEGLSNLSPGSEDWIRVRFFENRIGVGLSLG